MKSINTSKISLFLLISLGILFSVNAQSSILVEEKESSPLIHEIETGFFVGGSGTVYFFTYNSALSLSLATGANIGEHASLMGSVGIEKNIEGTLYPIAANLKRYFANRKNQFVAFHMGYGFGSGENENSSFEYGGGPLGGIAYGINVLNIKGTKVYAQIGYKLRQVNLRFQPFDGGDLVNDKLDNHFIAFQLGVQF
jgi:hypothetical protein